jgi:hypothetical protein
MEPETKTTEYRNTDYSSWVDLGESSDNSVAKTASLKVSFLYK